MDSNLVEMNTQDNQVQEKPVIIAPSYCCFVVTLKCLMKCKMCHIWKSNEDDLSELSLGEWKHTVSSLKGFLDTKYDIILSGGEPLLKKGILDLVNFITKTGYKVSLETNAYLIDEELVKKIRDSGLWRICISLDSLDEDTHDFLRGRKGAYSRTMKAIEYLYKLCPTVGINIQTIIMQQNLDGLVELAEWVGQDERLSYIYFQAMVRPFGSPLDEHWFKSGNYEFLWPDGTKKVRSVINELIKLKEFNSKIVNTANQLNMYAEYFENPFGFSKDINCTIGNRDINVNPYGDLYLCFSKESLGNVKNYSIRDMWYSQRAAEVRKSINECKKYCHFLLNCSFEDKK